jgi:hypothetical protein
MCRGQWIRAATLLAAVGLGMALLPDTANAGRRRRCCCTYAVCADACCGQIVRANPCCHQTVWTDPCCGRHMVGYGGWVSGGSCCGGQSMPAQAGQMPAPPKTFQGQGAVPPPPPAHQPKL